MIIAYAKLNICWKIDRGVDAEKLFKFTSNVYAEAHILFTTATTYHKTKITVLYIYGNDVCIQHTRIAYNVYCWGFRSVMRKFYYHWIFNSVKHFLFTIIKRYPAHRRIIANKIFYGWRTNIYSLRLVCFVAILPIFITYIFNLLFL